jgi:predicted house-cleaning noncanonical NTP pyrophosphatase (MazG superfamily)
VTRAPDREDGVRVVLARMSGAERTRAELLCGLTLVENGPPKLVRDLVPDAIRANGQIPITHIADDEEYGERLREKLQEEVREFLKAEADGQSEELADTMEVVCALARHLDFARVLQIRHEKRLRLGAFADRVVWEGNCVQAPSELAE